MAARRPVVVQVAVVTVVASLVLGAAVVGVVALWDADGGWSASRVLRLWGLWSAVALPVGFVFGAIAFVVGRSLLRGRG